MTAKEIRESFKKFFESKEHLIVPSAPMVVKDDPTLMFTNAGMNQFKDIILGNATPKCRRQADSQKCLRVSGKHNDLEEVGHDTYHHTMFEMLGNWSFGDYFKKEAISWAWEYIVDVLKIDPKDLYATVFEGSPEEGLSRDDEAAGIWEQFLPKDHIINGSRHDNFWEMGDTGPCGPCSEIHVDSRPEEEKAKVPGRELVNKDHPQVIEIWNLVFMQYNRKADGSLEGLPAKVIDTGMGFERLVRTLQGKTSNYDTDVFQPLIKVLGDMAGCRYGEDEKTDIAMRVVVDHLRAIAFAIADGQLPSNAKAGYVIRRILRRAVRYGYTFLGQKEAFIYKLVPALVDEMGDAFPEIAAQQKLVMKVMQEEESSFLRTLENGIKLLQGVIDETKAAGKTEIAGDKAFTLFDTFGFPLDLTELICREQGLTVDEKGFDVCMQEQKNRARNAAEVKLGDWISPLPTSPKGEESFTSPSLPTSPKGEESHAACSSTENLTANNPDGNHSPLGETEGASFTIFTTRADTMFGVTFMVLAPESELVEKVTTAEQKAAVEEYIKYVKGRTERERMIDHKVTGVFSGSYAINPFTGEKNPIWISEYVLAGYGTGAIMAVPAHDSRDYAFAKHFGLPIIPLIEGADVSEESYDAKEGIVTNSPRKDVKPYIDFSLNGLTVKEAIAATKKYVKEAGIGRVKVNYRLRDAIFSRQRYWGEPFPVYYKNGIPTMIPEECLPIELPEVDKFLPTETGEPPLGNATVWAWDEVNKKIVENSKIDNKTVFPIELYTMPGFAGSSAYYLRYMDPHNDKALVSKEADEYWQNVDLYVGGSEHATGHLIYSRFWNKFLFDMGVSCKEEPFQKLINQGMIQGRSNFVYRIKDTNTFVTLEKKDQYDVTPIHVDVNIVSADVLDVEAFKAWRPEYNTAEFILNDEGKYVCGWAVEKMSKSMFNVVNPDMIVEKFGADTLRLYEMFLGPVEQSKPWDTNGIDGCHRFLKKLWKFMTSPLPLPSSERALSSVAPDSATFSCPVSPLATPKGEENHAACSSTENQTANNPNGNHSPLGETVGASKEELKALHTLIKKETADIEAFSYNTTIAAFMVCLNELTKLKSESREVKESLAILLAPFCPHLAEEFWHLLGHDTSVCDAPWPAFNEDYLKEDSVKMMVAFNGKARFPLEFPADVTKEEAEKAALADPQSAKWMEGFTVAKVIVVPGKMINVVLKK